MRLFNLSYHLHPLTPPPSLWIDLGPDHLERLVCVMIYSCVTVARYLVHRSLSLSSSFSLSLSLSLSLSVALSCLSLPLSLPLSFIFSLSLYLSLLVFLSLPLSLYLSINQTVYLSTAFALLVSLSHLSYFPWEE